MIHHVGPPFSEFRTLPELKQWQQMTMTKIRGGSPAELPGLMPLHAPWAHAAWPRMAHTCGSCYAGHWALASIV